MVGGWDGVGWCDLPLTRLYSPLACVGWDLIVWGLYEGGGVGEGEDE